MNRSRSKAGLVVAVLAVCVIAAAIVGVLLFPKSSSESRSQASVTKAVDLERGARLWRKCKHCHTVERNGPHRIGPNLHGLFGRKVGTRPGFRYSAAMREADFVWNVKTLERYLESPQKMLPENRMPFDGLSIERDRVSLVAYLKIITEK